MLIKIILCFLATIFKIVPRDKHIWVTGKITKWDYDNTPPAFFDNSKYFYLYLVEHTDENVYWLSSSKKEIDLLKSMNLPVVPFPSVKGIWLVLRAKYSFHHYGTNQISSILQGGMIQLDFWHGTPLKKIRYDVVGKPKQDKNIIKKWINQDGIEYVSSISEYLSRTILCNAFNVPLSQLMNFGYPRMDVMGYGEELNVKFCEKYSRDLLPFISLSKKYEKVFLYMPTWRDYDPDYFQKARIDFVKLNVALKKINAVFFLKLHPLTTFSALDKFDNIFQINNDIDIYPFLIYVDCLVTDYSSIYFDFLKLDKDIVFIPYDYDEYISERKLYFNYNDVTPGPKYYDFDSFIASLDTLNQFDYSEERKRVVSMLYDDYNFDACEHIYDFAKRQ